MTCNSFRVAIIYFCVLVLSAPAQTPNNSPAPPQTALKVTTRMVQVNVVVHSRKGEPATDLKKEDFTIYDQGQEQRVATFSMESTQPLMQAGSSKPAKLPPNTFTNRVELKEATPSAITIILLDGLNSLFEDQAYARQQVIRFLNQMQEGDRVALYTLGRELKVLYDFTSDPLALQRALAKHRGHLGTEVADSEYADSDTGNYRLDQFLNQANQKIADFQTIRRVEITQAAIEAIANHVARLPGRKNLIWISGGFPTSIGLDRFNMSDRREQRTFSGGLERVARAVDSANLAIYPIDTRGLVGMSGSIESNHGTANPREAARAPSQPKDVHSLQQSHDMMETLAQRTGGIAYYNSNDIQQAIRSAIDDTKVTYVLGYHPAHNNWDGSFHELNVQVNRKGLDVRYRKGYFAFADQSMKPEDRQKALQEAASSALDATSLGLTVRAARDVPQPGKIGVILRVSARNVNFEQKGDRWTGVLDILFVQQPAAGHPANVVNDTITFNLTRERYLAALREGLLFAKDLNLADAAYLLRVAVRDAGSGNMGSVNIRTDRLKPEPPPAAAAPKPVPNNEQKK